MGSRRLIIFAALTGALLAPAPASAHRSPANCLVNGVDLPLFESATVVRPGDTMTFRVGVQNTNNVFGVPCDLTNANVGFRMPTSSGRYDPASTPISLGTNQSYPSGFGPRQVGGDLTWVVNLADPRQTTGAAQAQIQGRLHVTAADPDTGAITKDISFTVTNPSITIDKTGSTTGGVAPQNVVYTYVVTNTSQTPVPMNQVTVQDDLCANPTYASGDNGDTLLSNGEQWTFTCSSLFNAAGTFTNTAKACAMSTVDDRPVCSPPDTWTVVVTPPPPPPAVPQVAVKPASATQPKQCTLATASKLKVRARELTTIKVTAKNVPAKTRVKIKLPGGKTVTARTNKKGVAMLRVRPKKSGKASITAAKCSDVEKLTVRRARKTVSQRVPQVTG
jgi:uncharacterized repeat protein (TIGR01451 family)